MNAIKRIFKSYFLTGLLVLGPLVISGYIIKAIIETADTALNTANWLPFPIPGLGIVLALGIILLAGFLGRNVIGRFVFSSAGEIIGRVPVIGGIYSSTKQVFEALLGNKNRHFGRVVLVEYPHSQSWTLAFVTAEEAPKEIQAVSKNSLISVYVPTTPNPTSGFFLFVPRDRTVETSMTVDAGFKLILSLGIVHGSEKLKSKS